LPPLCPALSFLALVFGLFFCVFLLIVGETEKARKQKSFDHCLKLISDDEEKNPKSYIAAEVNAQPKIIEIQGCER